MNNKEWEKECTASTNHDHWCDCGRQTCWEEQLRARVNFDKNQDREVAYLFIHRLLKEERTHLLEDIKKEIEELSKYPDHGYENASDIITKYMGEALQERQ